MQSRFRLGMVVHEASRGFHVRGRDCHGHSYLLLSPALMSALRCCNCLSVSERLIVGAANGRSLSIFAASLLSSAICRSGLLAKLMSLSHSRRCSVMVT